MGPDAAPRYRIGEGFQEEHAVGGLRVTLRLIRPDDGVELRRSFARLSPTSRYRRFLAGTPELTDEMVRYLTHCDGVDHVAIVAATDSLDLKSETGLGVARLIRLPDEPSVAEAAVTVIDEAQGKGVGHLLLQTLAEAAWERGIRTFRAEVLASNAPMRRILDEVGAVVRSEEGGTLVLDVPLEWRPEHWTLGGAGEKPSPLRRLFRALVEALAALRIQG